MSDSTINSNILPAIPLRGDLSDRGDAEIKSNSEEGEFPSNVLEEASGITLDSTVPALQTAYRNTFLKIPTPDYKLSKQEVSKQLESVLPIIAKDAYDEASASAASGVLNIIEAADIADAKILQRAIQASYSEPDSIYPQSATGRTYNHSQQLGLEQVSSVSDIVYTNAIALGTSSFSKEDSSSASEDSLSSTTSTTLPKLSNYESGAFNSLPNKQLPSNQQNRLFAIMAAIHHERNPGSFQPVGLLNNKFSTEKTTIQNNLNLKEEQIAALKSKISTAKGELQAGAPVIEADLKEIQADFQEYQKMKATTSTSTNNSSKDSSQEEKALFDISNQLDRTLAQYDSNEAQFQSKEAIDRVLRCQQATQFQQLQASYRILKELLRSPGTIAVSA